MATAYKLEPEYEYSPAFLDALEQVAGRSCNHWLAAAAERDGAVAESFRNRAAQYRDLRRSALSAQDGLNEGFDELDEYFSTDFLVIRPEVEAVMRGNA